MSDASKWDVIKVRAALFKQARTFFDERGVVEVDCPMLLSSASIDAHIDLIVCGDKNHIRYLHSSPEYCMKRLLSQGCGDIYQLGHVFRAYEKGARHNPEFTMAEWYRIGFTFEEMIAETCDFIALFVGDLPRETKTYQELFLHYTQLDPLTASVDTLLEWIAQKGHTMHYQEGIDGKDDLLSYILATFVEPHLGHNSIVAVTDFPKSQAALAKVKDANVAARFEVFVKGIELANGYHELQDATEQRKRFIEANVLRKRMGKEALPIDERFLEALESGFKECCGVAVGFDRLVVLHQGMKQPKLPDISSILPFGWDEA